MTAVLTTINHYLLPVLWGWPVLLAILCAGIFYTVLLKGFQLRHLGLWMRNTFGSLFRRKKDGGSDRGITPFQSVSTALAGSIGTGNIVGVATAITLGGPGALFWMWVSALFGMMTIYGETVLGLRYRTKDTKGRWIGGAMYYLEYGVKKKWLGCIFAGACACAAIGMGNMTQSNAIADALLGSLSLPKVWTGILCAVVLAIVLMGGIRRIAAVTETIVPFMSLLYLGAGFVVLAVHWNNILPAFGQIFSGAFSFQSAAGGIGGYGIMAAMKSGLSRGIFTNEAGLGSSVMAHAAADTDEPCEQGMWGIFQVFLDTIVVCSVTGLCILSTGVLSTGLDGGALSSSAFETVFGVFGKHTMTVCVVFFAFATMLGWSYYGECAVRYLCGTSAFCQRHVDKIILLYRLLYAVSAVAGSCLDLYVVWDFCGNFNGLMAIPNLYALFRLSPQVKKETQSYLRRKTGRPPGKSLSSP
ncbi:MAG: sodium:alanine symporter family protein [Oscillospiraceae bacterium]|nr:sodium:alanine symporter family protein [Oscillospiraceae bacterium]